MNVDVAIDPRGLRVDGGMGDSRGPDLAGVVAVPLDEPHRFLRHQRHRDGCAAWIAWFTRQGVPFVVLLSEHGWTIYKHRWTGELHSVGRENRIVGAWCCGATG